MEEIITLIIEYWSMWVPSILSCLAVLAGVIPVIVKVKDGLNEIKKTQEFKEVKTKLEEVAAENQELIRCNKLLIDKITKIEGYADATKEE